MIFLCTLLSRVRLAIFGVSVESPHNLVSIDADYHQRIHTDAYHAAVTLVLMPVTSRHGVFITLQYLKILILTRRMPYLGARWHCCAPTMP